MYRFDIPYKTWLHRTCKPQVSRAALLRCPGNEGAQSLATALAQLTQLKELQVYLQSNQIGGGPQGVEGPSERCR